MVGAAASTASSSNPPPSSLIPASIAEGTMTTVSRHYFGEESTEDSHCFYIDIIENIEENYGMFIWPCSIILAEYVWQQRSRFAGKKLIELGAGTSLPGLVAAKVGADVTLTDDFRKPDVVENMRRICSLNKLDCKILGLTWGEWDAPLFELQPHVILGADVFYDSTGAIILSYGSNILYLLIHMLDLKYRRNCNSEDFDDLFATVTFLLQSSQGAVFITTYHNRSGHHLIEFLMAKWGLKCLKLLDGLSFIPSCKASSLQGNIQLVEIALDDKRTFSQ